MLLIVMLSALLLSSCVNSSDEEVVELVFSHITSDNTVVLYDSDKEAVTIPYNYDLFYVTIDNMFYWMITGSNPTFMFYKIGGYYYSL